MTEDDAYHYMRKKAMNQGRRLTDVAQEVCDGLAPSSMAASDYAAGGHLWRLAMMECVRWRWGRIELSVGLEVERFK